jgi:SAM-dependent methyltransferase
VTTRSLDRVREHYTLERGLADRLRAAPADQRVKVYGEVYDELFRSMPDHPQLSIDPSERRREALAKLRFVARFLTKDSCLMEIGAGDCVFSINAAPMIRRGVVVDVSEVIVSAAADVPNIEIVISDGVSLPVKPSSVDVAFSDQLMEHLHPDDAEAQLVNVAKAIRPGGVYVCITPNRVSGPHDVSRGFDDVATGLHLREYSGRELRGMLFGVGFRKVAFYAGGRGRYVRIPASAALLAESAFLRLPKSLRKRVPLIAAYAIFGLNIVATRLTCIGPASTSRLGSRILKDGLYGRSRNRGSGLHRLTSVRCPACPR